MNTNKNYFELIDSYLNGQMSGVEATDFESQLAKDPLLEGEFQLQKDVVESIRNFRKAELKATLDTVEVGVGTGGFTALKVAASIVVASMLGFGAYYFTSQSEQPEEIAQKEIIDDAYTVETEQISGAQEDVQSIVEEQTPSPIIETQVDHSTSDSKEEAIEITIPENNAGEKSIEPDVNLPVVVEDFKQKAEGELVDNVDVPQNRLDQVTETVLPKTEVVQMKKGKYAFHYQFYNNKLYLYGDFENTYEILELNTPSGISIYMFYKDNFYELIQHQKKITALEAIEDATLLEDLKIIRKK